ncbi:MAG TPA: hypothetical protein VGJ49_05495 [Gaiellaceae bacterium]|jgi:hypothetical protein
MRRVFLALIFAVIGAAFLAAGAFAKESGVELSSTPFGTNPGDPWSGTLTVISDDNVAAQAKPTITIRNLGTGETQTFATKPAKVPTTAHSQSFVFSVVFPDAGRYRYTVRDGVTDRQYDYPIVQIGPADAPAAVPPSGDSSNRSIPVWPIVGGAGGAGLLALAAFVALRSRRRFGLSH